MKTIYVGTTNSSLFFQCCFSDYRILEGDIAYYDEPNDYEAHEDAVREDFKWDLDVNNGTVPIPYLIDSRISQELREKIATAIDEYRKKTCIRYICKCSLTQYF